MQNKDWPSIAGLFGTDNADIALIGAPMTLGSVTPGNYDKAPTVFRSALKRISTYDLETGIDLDGTPVRDYGDIDIKNLSPADSFAPIITACTPMIKQHALSAIIGGHNGVTRAGVHALDPSLKNVGLLTLDAHFDLRSTKDGLMNGNPVQALLDDGLSGAQIAQVGIAPFANSAAMHRTAINTGISVYTLADCREHGTLNIIVAALKKLTAQCDVIYVDFDIDVIDRAQSPGAPGGRSGGFSALEFFEATRLIAAHNKVRAVDLTEFDPSLDVSDITALISGRWFAEILMGFHTRSNLR